MAAPRLTPDPLQVDHTRASIDDALLRNLHVLLFHPDAAADAMRIAAELARREASVAAMLAERIRADRARWLQEVQLPLSTPSATLDRSLAARAVVRAGRDSLAATVILELEERGGADRSWAAALVELAGDSGRAHLTRMRGRPGWSALSPMTPPEGLEALVSPVADIRSAAIDALAGTPNPRHLRALLLATELDRHVVRDVLRAQWTRPRAARWLPLLSAHAAATRLDRRLAQLPKGSSDIAATRGEHLLLEMVDCGAGRLPLNEEQEISPALRELEVLGAKAYAERWMPDPRLTEEERIALDTAEADLCAYSARRWG